MNPYEAPRASLDPTGSTAGDGLVLSPTALGHLSATRPWVAFLGALSLAAVALMGLSFGFVAFTTLRSTTTWRLVPLAPLFFLTILYVGPAIYLRRYARGIKRLVAGGGTPALEEALGAQRRFWMFTGILAIVFVVGYLAMTVAMVAVPGFNRRLTAPIGVVGTAP